MHAPFVRKMHRFGDRLEPLRGLARWHRLLPSHLGQAAAFDQLHREVGLAVVLTYFINRNDVGMGQAGGRFRLAAEPQTGCLVGEFGAEQHFHCH